MFKDIAKTRPKVVPVINDFIAPTLTDNRHFRGNSSGHMTHLMYRSGDMTGTQWRVREINVKYGLFRLHLIFFFFFFFYFTHLLFPFTWNSKGGLKTFHRAVLNLLKWDWKETEQSVLNVGEGNIDPFTSRSLSQHSKDSGILFNRWGRRPLYGPKIIQSTLVISKSKGLSEILRDIRSSTYQICRIEEKINRTTTFYK